MHHHPPKTDLRESRLPAPARAGILTCTDSPGPGLSHPRTLCPGPKTGMTGPLTHRTSLSWEDTSLRFL